MKLIKETRFKINKEGNKVKYGLFLCPYCLQEVEKRLSDGYKCQSCGCQRYIYIKNNTRSESNTKLYRVWVEIKRRVFDCNRNSYKNYGGRGIQVCNDWLKFIPFRDWVLSNGYKENLQINRINNNGNYEPNNCNFVTSAENCRNRRSSKLSLILSDEIRYLYSTGNYIQKELGIKYNVSIPMISNIINNKMWKKGIDK